MIHIIYFNTRPFFLSYPILRPPPPPHRMNLIETTYIFQPNYCYHMGKMILWSLHVISKFDSLNRNILMKWQGDIFILYTSSPMINLANETYLNPSTLVKLNPTFIFISNYSDPNAGQKGRNRNTQIEDGKNFTSHRASMQLKSHWIFFNL